MHTQPHTSARQFSQHLLNMRLIKNITRLKDQYIHAPILHPSLFCTALAKAALPSREYVLVTFMQYRPITTLPPHPEPSERKLTQHTEGCKLTALLSLLISYTVPKKDILGGFLTFSWKGWISFKLWSLSFLVRIFSMV